MALHTPKEPNDIRAAMKVVKNTLNDSNSFNIEYDGFVVWAGTQNRFAAYLWKEWKPVLSPRGFTWQKFTKLLHYKTDRMIYWYRDMITWKSFVKEVIDLLEGKYGQSMVK